MYFVYILQNIQTKWSYKGLTSNLEKRLPQHFSGKVASTRSRLPLHLVHVEVCNSRLEARKLEKFFKTGYGRELIKELSSE
ncbi:MAG: hypothetical protein A3H88_01660 [Candidatus Blackburnbacteria bacterium RIFCSPLOWO2_02_FULL_44_9]|uniref:GIY-YIG domain-containing protein n=1 Tax=Candidatus Blackburnbacteria bacterium RIFCSPHIGHO2_02_FULL_44_20 TaxID=1797516 RepID=A0A1G1V9U9_9BACT|nr:MAG: hypothetical protein A3D26_04105 [Candidatus Blackburnbacteria bacterium RIFCSPHIGHO2_02_FULL_44_20]OGY15929.1 MAG: hypothetical protein A3H88_01660 [Candidatus Blackburnbacteria bacterium RIFCSPLOWO2_02_FULL_44_9]